MLEDNLNQSIARPELLQIAESVAREKSIDQSIVIEAMEQAIQSVAKKKYGQDLEVKASIDDKTGEIEVFNDITTGLYDVVYVAGSTLPTNRFAELEFYMDAFAKGLISILVHHKKRSSFACC